MDDAKIQSMMAKARVDMAKEQEVIASAGEKMAKIQDLHADAEYKSARADLELVREMVTLEDMDLQNFRNALDLAEYVKKINKQSQQPAAQAI